MAKSLITLGLKSSLALLAVTILTGCATPSSLDTTKVNSTVQPKEANSSSDSYLNKIVHWGGTILELKNLRDQTEVTVLGFPFDSSGAPNTGQKPIGRFILIKKGFLEPLDFRKGKVISAVGSISGKREGQVGESDYTYSLMEAQQIQLWPDPPQRGFGSHFSIGVGIGL